MTHLAEAQHGIERPMAGHDGSHLVVGVQHLHRRGRVVPSQVGRREKVAHFGRRLALVGPVEEAELVLVGQHLAQRLRLRSEDGRVDALTMEAEYADHHG